MATKTRTKSPLQPADDFPSVFVTRNSTLPPSEDERGYLNTHSVEFVNAERTIAVVHSYRDYNLVVKSDLTVEQLANEDSYYLTSDGYADTRARGVYFVVTDLGRNKTNARAQAERFLKGVQNIERPLDVSLDGKYAPALTIALKKVEAERDYRRDDERVRAVYSLAEEAGVDPRLLALAIKENRLVWSTPPVAPKQVMVVVREDETANLSERLVDEVVLAEGTVEGLGKIVQEGSVAEYLLRMRTFRQKRSVEGILNQREKTQEALQAVISRATNLLESLEKGEVIGRGFHDTLRLSEEAEKAQQAATSYASEVQHADLPSAFLQSLLKNEYRDTDSKYRWGREDVRNSLKALAAINGMSLKDEDGYY